MDNSIINKIFIIGIIILGIITCKSEIFSANSFQESLSQKQYKISDSHVNSIKCEHSISKFQLKSISYVNEHFSVNLKPILRLLKAIYKEMTKFRKKLGFEFSKELINKKTIPRLFPSNF